MTIQVKTNMHYAVSGEQFDLLAREDGTIEQTIAILNIYTRDNNEGYELSVPDPVKKGQFFNSECYCAFLNEKDEVLRVGETTLFKTMMMRDGQDQERLHVKFDHPVYEGEISWVPVTES